jgi:hypothetical protein
MADSGHDSPAVVDRPDSVNNPYTDRLIALGRSVDKDMAKASIDKCNCMIRYAHMDTQLPAIRKGKEFFTPEGYAIIPPNSFEDMDYRAIHNLMKSRGDEYIGHMFAPLPAVTAPESPTSRDTKTS